MSYIPQNANGQATMANSEPVVIASDQSAVPVSGPLTDTELRAAAVPVAVDVPTSLAHGSASVTTSGTRVNLASNAAKSVLIKADAANTGVIYVGGSSVTSANGFILAAGDTMNLAISNTDVIWLDSSVSGETIRWISTV